MLCTLVTAGKARARAWHKQLKQKRENRLNSIKRYTLSLRSGNCGRRRARHKHDDIEMTSCTRTCCHLPHRTQSPQIKSMIRPQCRRRSTLGARSGEACVGSERGDVSELLQVSVTVVRRSRHAELRARGVRVGVGAARLVAG